MGIRFTKTALEAEHAAMLASGETRRVLWDKSEVAGFGANLTTSGITLFIQYRVGGNAKRMKIGRLGPGLTVEKARKKAGEIKVNVHAGADPKAERKAAAIAETKAKAALTVGQAIEQWMERGAKKWRPATLQGYRWALNPDLIPQLGTVPLANLTRQMIMNVINDVSGRSSSAGAALFRIMSSFVNHCDAHGLTVGLSLPKPRNVVKPIDPRTRMPDDDHLVSIWKAAERLRPRSRALARMIILTAQRKLTVELMEWSEIDLDAGRWMIPGRKMKKGKPLVVALSPFALAELRALRRAGRYIFSDTAQAPDRLGRILKSLHTWAPGERWSWHDFRRSFRTWAQRNGHPREHARMAMGQMVKDALDKAYDQHDYEPEMAKVMLAWQGHLERLVMGGGGDNVVPMRRPHSM